MGERSIQKAVMGPTNHIPCIRHFLSLPCARNRNCEEPVKGQARWRGSLRSPLTEPSQLQSTPPLWKRKKKTERSPAPHQPNGVKMYTQSQPSDPAYPSTESATPCRLATERRTWLTAAEAAQYLNVKTRTILLWVRQGKVKAYPLTGTQRRIWRFLHADLEAMVTQKKPVVISAQPSVLANERSI